MRFLEVNVPTNCKIIIWNNTNTDGNSYIVHVLHKSKIFKFVFKNNHIKIDKWANSLVLKNFNTLNKINEFFKLWNIFYIDKIKFKGKGFKIRFFKKKKFIKFYFGKSHITQILLNKIKKKRINKYKFVIFGLNKQNLKNVSKTMKNIKKVNFYTLRGIRSGRQIIYKRKGKKGTYI